MPGVVDQKPTTGTRGIVAGVGAGVGSGLGSAVELGSAWRLRTAVAGWLGSVVGGGVGAGLAQATTMAARSTTAIDGLTNRHMRTGAA